MIASPISPVLEDIANKFWQPLISYKTFPVDFDRALALSNLHIDVVNLSNLTVAKIQCWISENDFPISFTAEDRLLHGFLLAHHGMGVIFVNGTDSLEERRFTVAHETAHFLLDYQLPRQQFISAFGESVTEILDGKRAPTLSERIQFIAADLPSPFSVNHLDSQYLTAYDRHLIWQAERRIDMLATELLAPFKEVVQKLVSKKNAGFQYYVEQNTIHLSTTFGLPIYISQAYAKYIAQYILGGDTLFEEWQLAY